MLQSIESGSKEVSEEEMLEALMFGHEAIKELCALEEDIISEIGEEKIEVILSSIDPEVEKVWINDNIKEDMSAAIQIKDKLWKLC